MKGKCIFHGDNDPSFIVWLHTQKFKCFGCDVADRNGSDVIGFIRTVENLSFQEAVEFLARRAGLRFEKNDENEKYYRQNERRQQKYLANIANNPRVMDYLKARGLTEETIKEFGIGYGGLKVDEHDYFSKKYYDRITFPIRDTYGKVVAFAGRILSENDGREKYDNDPTSPIFTKGAMFYQISMARKHIQEANRVYLVEGYFDKIMLYQKGIKNSLALMSTNLSERQINTIKKYTDNVTLIMDGDKAGEQAMIKHISELEKNGINVTVVVLPNGMDPDDLTLKMTKKELQSWLANNSRPADFYQVGIITNFASDLIVRAQNAAIEKLIPILKTIQSKNRLDMLIKIISSSLGIDKQVIRDELSENGGKELGKED
jgi:DNA primase